MLPEIQSFWRPVLLCVAEFFLWNGSGFPRRPLCEARTSLAIFQSTPEPLKYSTSSGETWPAVLDPEEVWDCGLTLLQLQSLGWCPCSLSTSLSSGEHCVKTVFLLDWVLSS